MHLAYKNITNFFEEQLNDLECQPDTKSYIISIYDKYKSTQFDLSKDSITILFAQAKNNQDFLTYQNLGDWLFYTKSVFPEHLKNASENYYNSIAQLSYYTCYRMIRTWKIYEELADKYVPLTKQIRKIIKNQFF